MEPKLCVAAIIHKAVIEVDEKGTEAAAATAIRMVLCSSSAVELLNIIFKVNMPFAFWVLTGNEIIPFAGICDEPLSG